VTEVGSVKDNFRLSGRREESQREVKEPDIGFREAGTSPVGSGVGWLFLCTGITSDGVVCSGNVLKSMSVGLGGDSTQMEFGFENPPTHTYLALFLSLRELVNWVPQGSGTLVSGTTLMN